MIIGYKDVMINEEEYKRLQKVKVPIWMEITRPDGESLVIRELSPRNRSPIRNFMKKK